MLAPRFEDPAMLTRNAKGVFVIAPTPFLPDGALDLASADRMTDAFLAAGASGLTLLGVMGEAPKLDQPRGGARAGGGGCLGAWFCQHARGGARCA
jgi:hypothetical protein